MYGANLSDGDVRKNYQSVNDVASSEPQVEMLKDDEITNRPKGLPFRQEPFLIAIMYPRTQSPAQRMQYLLEIVREDIVYRETFGVKEVGA